LAGLEGDGSRENDLLLKEVMLVLPLDHLSDKPALFVFDHKRLFFSKKRKLLLLGDEWQFWRGGFIQGRFTFPKGFLFAIEKQEDFVGVGVVGNGHDDIAAEHVASHDVLLVKNDGNSGHVVAAVVPGKCCVTVLSLRVGSNQESKF